MKVSVRRTLMRFFLCLAVAASIDAQPLIAVSAASFEARSALAPEMIVTAFSGAIVTPFAGYSITVRDTPARVLGIAEGQIIFIMPADAATGDATITLRSPDRILAVTAVRITAVAPGIFTANSSGMGAPAGHLLEVQPDQSRSITDLFEVVSGGLYLPRPFFNSPGRLFLSLYGTGIRGRRGNVTATVGGKPVPVLATAAHGMIAGLDQVNLGPLPSFSTDRRGELDVAIEVDGVAANRVTIAPNGPALGHWGTRAQLLEGNADAPLGLHADHDVYNPVTDTWISLTPMPTPIHGVTGLAFVNGLIYLPGGGTSQGGNSGSLIHQVYRPAIVCR